MKVNPSALRHGISESDILHAAQNWAYASDPDEDMPARQFVLGFDRGGRLLEVGYVDGEQTHVIVHAMLARKKFLR